MTVLLDILLIIIGIFLLVKGGDYLVDSSVSLAKRAKLSPMVIGLTIMGFGTSAPELIVSTQAALAGSPGIAIGNVVGSNIGNTALILGVTALICPLRVLRSTLRIDVPIMLIAFLMFIGFATFGTGTIERWQGILFILLIVAFTSWQIVDSRKKNKQAQATEQTDNQPIMSAGKAIVIAALSIAAMVYGAHLLVDGSANIAYMLGELYGVSPSEMERVVGLTIVAIGTSLPELFASVISARKGQADMAIGNVIGSNTFNIFCVVGVSSTICPITNCNVGFTLDYTIMLALALLLWLFLRTKHLLEHWEGAVLLTAYIAFIAKTLMV